MKLIDSHTHLSSVEFDEIRTEALDRAFKVCDYLIDIGSGTSPDAYNRAKNLAESDPRIYFTAGVHPHDAETLGKNPQTRLDIEALLSHPKCVAVGECGLDYYYKHSGREAQMEVFKWQIELAKKFKLPIMIHTRDAEEDTKNILSTYEGPAVFHCFTGTQDLADFALTKKISISFSGIVTFKTAEDLRKVFLSLPLDRILIETDSPYLAPVPMRGKKNESSFIEHTARFLANLKNLSFESFSQATSENSRRLFSKINQPG